MQKTLLLFFDNENAILAYELPGDQSKFDGIHINMSDHFCTDEFSSFFWDEEGNRNFTPIAQFEDMEPSEKATLLKQYDIVIIVRAFF